MKANLRYQNGYLYKDHGSWYVRYRQRISQEDGSSHVCKRLGRSEDFCNILRSNAVGQDSCRPLIVIGSVQIPE
jgi:hypothetical protein